jgi:myo-inositol-1(or 4)-monophosphatase
MNGLGQMNGEAMTDNSIDNIDLFLDSAHKMADLSAREILPFFRREFSVLHKEGKGIFDPVTDADRKSEEVIRSYLAEEWPDHSIIGEEFGQDIKDDDHCWIIDPIDGTRAFVLGSPLWGTLIGLSFKGRPVIGMMNQPFTGERFWASPDGAFARWGGTNTVLKTRDCQSISEAVITTTCPDLFATDADRVQFDELRSHCRMTRYGGDCYNYCLLAMGTVDLIVESGLAPYDIAPLIPLIERSGGVITTWSGESAANGGQIIAAGSKQLHEKALALLSKSAL